MKTQIITHNGKAHLDDFLASAVLAAWVVENGGEPEITRKQWPSSEDLTNPEVWVLDFGKEHNPALKNFDHHQISGGEQCAFTLLLEYLGMRDYDAMPWISFVEKWDNCGPTVAMASLGGGNSALIYSPVEDFALKKFSAFEGVIEDLSEIIELGKFILGGYKNYISTTEELKKVTIQKINRFNVADYREIPGDFPLNFPAADKFEKENDVDIVYTINTRGTMPFRMIRKKDHIDFNKAAGLDGVDFIHQNGFLICFSCDYRLIFEKL